MVSTPRDFSSFNRAIASVIRLSSSPHGSGKFCMISADSTKTCSCIKVTPSCSVLRAPLTVFTCCILLSGFLVGTREAQSPQANERFNVENPNANTQRQTHQGEAERRDSDTKTSQTSSSILSAMRSESAAIVSVGLTPNAVGMIDPSAM